MHHLLQQHKSQPPDNDFSSSFIIISGCSGAGKSTLLMELQSRGYAVVHEPGRRVVQEEVRSHGQALPWIDLEAFLRKVIKLAQTDYVHAGQNHSSWVFFDRGVIDAGAALQALTGEINLNILAQQYRYFPHMFLAPPWPEIYRQDTERRHDISTAQNEYDRLQQAYPELGYTVSLLPKLSVTQRADFVIQTLITQSSMMGRM